MDENSLNIIVVVDGPFSNHPDMTSYLGQIIGAEDKFNLQIQC